jgi:non-lysosomal glucosylceramidase
MAKPPGSRLGFAPRWQQDHFKCFFTAAEGWGSLHQRRSDNSQENHIEVKYGQVTLRELLFEVPKSVKVQDAVVTASGQPVRSGLQQKDRIVLTLDKPVELKADQSLKVTMNW